MNTKRPRKEESVSNLPPRPRQLQSSYDPVNPDERERIQFQSDLFRSFDHLLIDRATLALSESKRLNVLDLGCGDGTQAWRLWEGRPEIGHYVGIDTSRMAVDLARHQLSDSHFSTAFHVADLTDCDVHEVRNRLSEQTGRSTFDLIVAFASLQHVGNPVAAVRRFEQLLHPQGAFVARAPDDHLMLLHPDPDDYLSKTLDISRRLPGASDRHAGRKLYEVFYRSGFQDIELMTESHTTVGRSLRERRYLFQTFFTHRRLTADRALKASKDNPGLKSDCDSLMECGEQLELVFEDETAFFVYVECGYVARRAAPENSNCCGTRSTATARRRTSIT